MGRGAISISIGGVNGCAARDMAFEMCNLTAVAVQRCVTVLRCTGVGLMSKPSNGE